MFTVWVIVVLAAIGAGVYIFAVDLPRTDPGSHRARDGWVYFLSPVGGDEGDRPEPIKIGMTHRDPGQDRMPEIATMSPTPLEVLYCYSCRTPEIEEARVHNDLASHRLHGEWFERYPTLAYIDHLKSGI